MRCGAIAMVGCAIAVSGCGSARVVTRTTTTSPIASTVRVAQTTTTVTETGTTTPTTRSPAGGLLTRGQVKAAEAAGAAIVADCNAQYAGTETDAQGNAAVKATFTLEAAYKRDANTTYPNT